MAGSITVADSESSGAACAHTSSSPGSSSGNPPLDDDLRRLVAAWPTLPAPIRARITAMVEAAKGA